MNAQTEGAGDAPDRRKQQMTTNEPMLFLQSLPVWLNKIQPWLNGERVGDAPQRDKTSKLRVQPDALTFHGPFATVTLAPSGTMSHEGRWVAHVLGCANPAHEYYNDLSKAVSAWAGSVWHTAIRGVIG